MKIILFIIRLYQKTLSPDHGWFKYKYPYGYCKFYPTCSEYIYQAVEKKGVIKGLGIGFLRVMRCNPWNKNRIDLVK